MIHKKMRRSNNLKNKKLNKKITNTKRKKKNNIRKYRSRGGAAMPAAPAAAMPADPADAIVRVANRVGIDPADAQMAAAAHVGRNVGLRIDLNLINRDDRDLVAQYFKGAVFGYLREHGVPQELQNLIEREAQQFIQQGHQRFFKIRDYMNGYVLVGGDEYGNPDWDTIKVFINDINLEGFFRGLRDTINQHLGEEGINLINLDIEEDKLDFSFYEWWREQEVDQRRSPSLALSSA